MKWAGNSASATAPGTGQDPGRGDVRGPGWGGAGDRSGVHRRAPRRVGNSGRPPVPAHYRACAAAPRLRYGRQGTGGAGRAGVPGPGAGQAAWQGDRVASRLGPASAGVDVAVLDLGEDRLGWLPAPVPVWPAARPPRRVQVFGYPLAEGPLNGVLRQFVVAGPATPGAVQLDWIGEVGTFHQVLTGHDGGVWAVAVGRLPDGTPVIVSGGNPGDGTVRAWRLADGTPLAHPLDLSESAGASPFTAISSSPRPGRTSPSTTWPLHGSYEIVLCPAATVGRHGHRIMAGYPVHLWASAGDHAGRRSAAGRATRTRYPVHLLRRA